jgi:lysophospholipase L1-like esterase
MLENLLNEFSGLSHFKELQKKALIFNAGVGGDKVENIRYRMIDGKLVKNQYLSGVESIYLLMGTNNLNNKDSKCKDNIVDGILTIIYLLTKNFEKLLNIYIMNISPRTDIKQELIDDVNSSLLEMTKKFSLVNSVNVHYLNWTSQLLNDNQEINIQYYYDHIHLNADGYEIMYKHISETIDA